MNLVVFDIDGTLTATSEVDAVCYLRAFRDVFALDIEAGDWTRFTHYTDSGIMAQAFEEARGRPPIAEEFTAVQDRFIELLQREFERKPGQFQEVPGAVRTLSKLWQESNWRSALATGCWRRSAELKLDLAGFNWQDYPVATCDDSFARDEIMRNAVLAAKAKYGIDNFDKTVYVGDGIWDMRAARKLGFDFVGVQFENHHKKLENEGITRIISDYRDYATFLKLINHTE